MNKHAAALLVLLLFAWTTNSSHRGPDPDSARQELVGLMREHNQLYRASMDNLKNQFTPGYRASEIFGFMQRPEGRQLRLRMTQGLLKETKNPYDLAVDGDGFLLLQGDRLTRNGSLRMNADGHLLADGLAVLAHEARGETWAEELKPVTIPRDACNLEFTPDGKLFWTYLGGDGKPECRFRLALGRVTQPQWLQRDGTHLKRTDDSGPLSVGTPGRDAFGVVVQGFLEMSNLEPLEQLKTAEALRHYAGVLGAPAGDQCQP